MVRAAVVAFCLATALAVGAAAAAPLPGDVPVPQDFKLPASVPVAVYLPAAARKAHGMRAGGPGLVETGQTVEATVLSVAQGVFNSARMAEAGADIPYGLLIALHPEITGDSGGLTYVLHYSVFGVDSHELLKSQESVKLSPGSGDWLQQGALRTTQQAMGAIIRTLRPDAVKFPPSGNLKGQALGYVAYRDKPALSGTGFYFNPLGQILTAAHVTHDCLALEITASDKPLSAKVTAYSSLLDLAVIETGTPSARFLSFRRDGSYELGEPVTEVGFPLQDILGASPNVTRGNISSRTGMAGSVGQLQFSAPIQPGSSGGPVVSDGGEVLGITVGTLNAAALAKAGVLPQNVNFALDARYAVMFLRKNNIAFNLVDTNLHGDLHTANAAALGAVVGIRCYQ